jgi:hypothetical protein
MAISPWLVGALLLLRAIAVGGYEDVKTGFVGNQQLI